MMIIKIKKIYHAVMRNYWHKKVTKYSQDKNYRINFED